ncbi:P27 family phage terminase small subunit [Leifsonia sp. NPDC058292]|uniref:P27 family phage terminase small subunit n=1 Tax=Leifsonia sp. NPDC058292 TaxID=3346428 RepID=UPI0036DF97C1
MVDNLGKHPVPATPRSLEKRGRALWRTLFSGFEFDLEERDMVHELCRTLDTIDALSGRIDADGTMITGSTGQLVLHPAVAERRQQQTSFARMLQMLNLPEAEGGVAMERATSSRARAAADARWSKGSRKRA